MPGDSVGLVHVYRSMPMRVTFCVEWRFVCMSEWSVVCVLCGMYVHVWCTMFI